MKSTEIANQLGVTPRTIQRWIATGDIPYSRPRKQRPRLIDPYKAYILERLQQGCRKGAQLERELRAKGYKGSGRALYRYLETLEPTGSSPQHFCVGNVPGGFHTAPSTFGSLGITGHLALFPQARRFETQKSKRRSDS